VSIFQNPTKKVPMDAPKSILHVPYDFADRQAKLSITWGNKRKHRLDIEHVRSK
jgi:hypothetical protein